MSKEIVDAIAAAAEEKGIPPETLMVALEDALLSAYRKEAEYGKRTMLYNIRAPERLYQATAMTFFTELT